MKLMLVGFLIAIFSTMCSRGVDELSQQSQQSQSPASAPVPTATPLPTPTPSPTPATPTPTPKTPTPTIDVIPTPLKNLGVERAFPALSLSRMVAMAFPDDDTNRLFVALQPGKIMVFENDSDIASASEFLDITKRVNDRGNEEGLLGLAFDPDYSDNGYFYVYYSASNPRRSVIARFEVSADPDVADLDSERIILEVPQPFSNHNGGQLAFGPDGLLYISLGDGGSGGDPRGNGQNLRTLLGSILRIDVGSLDEIGSYLIPGDNPFVGRGGGVREEIYAYGLRNPWRFTFDRDTGDMWAGDVGQNSFEEVDLIKPGRNYGWNVLEGFHCFRRSDCDQRGIEPPIAEYGRDGGCSVTGGYVYRGSRLPSLIGAYVYADFCSGRIWALRYDGSQVTEHIQLIDTSLGISSFGEDRSGELFVLSFDGGIYRLVEK